MDDEPGDAYAGRTDDAAWRVKRRSLGDREWVSGGSGRAEEALSGASPSVLPLGHPLSTSPSPFVLPDGRRGGQILRRAARSPAAALVPSPPRPSSPAPPPLALPSLFASSPPPAGLPISPLSSGAISSIDGSVSCAPPEASASGGATAAAEERAPALDLDCPSLDPLPTHAPPPTPVRPGSPSPTAMPSVSRSNASGPWSAWGDEAKRTEAVAKSASSLPGWRAAVGRAHELGPSSASFDEPLILPRAVAGISERRSESAQGLRSGSVRAPRSPTKRPLFDVAAAEAATRDAPTAALFPLVDATVATPLSAVSVSAVVSHASPPRHPRAKSEPPSPAVSSPPLAMRSSSPSLVYASPSAPPPPTHPSSWPWSAGEDLGIISFAFVRGQSVSAPFPRPVADPRGGRGAEMDADGPPGRLSPRRPVGGLRRSQGATWRFEHPPLKRNGDL